MAGLRNVTALEGLPTFLKNNPEIAARLITYLGDSLEVAFLIIVAFIILIVSVKLSVFLIPFAFVALIVFSKKLTFDMALAISVILIGTALITLGWIKGLELMKNTEGPLPQTSRAQPIKQQRQHKLVLTKLNSPPGLRRHYSLPLHLRQMPAITKTDHH